MWDILIKPFDIFVARFNYRRYFIKLYDGYLYALRSDITDGRTLGSNTIGALYFANPSAGQSNVALVPGSMIVANIPI